jgi:hypothetical protein
MVLARTLVLLLLLVAAVLFALYAFTGNPRYKRLGLVVLTWTLVAALGFFAILVVQRLAA